MFKFSLFVLFLLASACAEVEEVKPIDPALLQGTWLSACLAVSDQYEKKSVEFEGLEVLMTSSRYSDAECTTEVDRLKGFATYGIESIDVTKSDIKPNFINYTFETLSWTFVSDPSTAVDYAVVCASTNTDGAVDLLDKSCAISDTITKVFSAKSYGIVEIKDSILFITDFESNGATAETRPKQYLSLTGLTHQ